MGMSGATTRRAVFGGAENAAGGTGELGYRIVDIDMTDQNLRRYQNPVNAIPYVDARTEQKTLLMPVSSEQTDFETELERKNIEAFQSVGYRVVTVATDADKSKGGIHRLVNVLQ